MALQYVSQTDPAVADAMRQELARERDSVELIASENFTSSAVMEAVGSVLTNKYAEGYPRKRYYGGCEKVDLVEDLARERACQLFGSNFANVQPHCGANANLGAYEALIELGDTVLGMSLAEGGHLTHGSPVNFSGRHYDFASYGVDAQTETIDYDEVERIAKEVRPSSSWAAPAPIRASSTSSAWPPSRARWARTSWWTWPTSPASWPQARTPAPCRTPTW